MLDGICGKIGAQCHVSHGKAKHDFVPFVKDLLQKQKGNTLAAGFKFTSEEVDFLIKMNRF